MRSAASRPEISTGRHTDAGRGAATRQHDVVGPRTRLRGRNGPVCANMCAAANGRAGDHAPGGPVAGVSTWSTRNSFGDRRGSRAVRARRAVRGGTGRASAVQSSGALSRFGHGASTDSGSARSPSRCSNVSRIGHRGPGDQQRRVAHQPSAAARPMISANVRSHAAPKSMVVVRGAAHAPATVGGDGAVQHDRPRRVPAPATVRGARPSSSSTTGEVRGEHHRVACRMRSPVRRAARAATRRRRRRRVPSPRCRGAAVRPRAANASAIDCGDRAHPALAGSTRRAMVSMCAITPYTASACAGATPA